MPTMGIAHPVLQRKQNKSESNKQRIRETSCGVQENHFV